MRRIVVERSFFRWKWSALTLVILGAAACSDSPIEAGAGIPAQLDVVSGDAQVGTVGEELPSALVVKVVDSRGRPVPNQLVNFRVTAGGGSVFAGSALTNNEGTAQERWTLGTSTQSEQRVEARAVSNVTGAALLFGTFIATAQAGPVASIETVAGAQQSALAESPLPLSPSVRARDQYANHVPGAPVMFTVATGGGTIANGAQTTDNDGIATSGTWTLGPSDGAQTLAVSSGQAPVLTITATARSTTPAQITIVFGNNQSAPVGMNVAASPTVLVQNALGDPLPGIAVSFAPTAGSGSVTQASVVTDALGHASAGAWTLGTDAGPQTLDATASLISTSFTATATHDVTSDLTVTAAPALTTEVGSDAAFVIRASDRFGNPVGGAEVIFEVVAGGGSIVPAAATTGVDGIASAVWTIGTAVGENTANARVGAVITTSASTVAVAAAPARLVKQAGDNQTAMVGTAVAVRPAVLVEDRFGNPVPAATVTFTIQSGGGSTSPDAVSGLDGVATASNWVLGTAATSNALLASAVGASNVAFTATARPGPPAMLTKTAGDGQTAALGTLVAVRPTVVARDSFGNPVPGTIVSFSVTRGGGSVTGATSTTDASGAASVGGWTVGDESGAQELTVMTDGAADVVFSATAAARVATVIAAHESNPTSVRIYDRINPAVVVRDQFGDPVQGVAVTFSSSQGQVTGANAVTDIAGQASVGEWRPSSCTGTATLTASAVGVSQALNMVVTVSPDLIGFLAMDREPTTQYNFSVDVGFLGRPVVTVRNVCQQPMSGLLIRFTVTVGVSFVEQSAVTTSASGVARPGQWRAGGVPGPTVLVASVDGSQATGSLSATIYHGRPARLVKLAGDEQTGPAGSTLPVAPSVRVEDQYGNAAPSYIGDFGVPSGAVSIRFAGLAGGTGISSYTPNSEGVVTATPWTLSSIPGLQLLTASVALSSVTTFFSAQATASPAIP